MERVLPSEQGLREVSKEDRSLSECVTAGAVPTPGLMDFNQWQVWRKGPGRRPRTSQGDPVTTTPRQEADLWRSTMQSLHGQDWRALLEEAQLAEAEASEDAPAANPAGAGGDGSAAATAASFRPGKA